VGNGRVVLWGGEKGCQRPPRTVKGYIPKKGKNRLQETAGGMKKRSKVKFRESTRKITGDVGRTRLLVRTKKL